MVVISDNIMPDIVLDTSAYSAFNRGDNRLKQFFDDSVQIIVPQIVVGELRAGFALGSMAEQNEKLLQRFLDSPNVHIISISDATTKLFAAIFYQLRKSGRPTGSNDIWIAALALEHDGLLVTLDSDFENVPDLMIAQL